MRILIVYFVIIVTCVSSHPPLNVRKLTFGQEEYNESVRQICCKIGEIHPKTVRCSDKFINPFSGGYMNSYCQESFDECCSRKRADEICSRGIQAAKDHGDCMLLTEDTRFGFHIIQSCCQGCEAGERHSCSAMSAGFGFNANPDADRGFLACCHKETAAVSHPLPASPKVQPVFHERRNFNISNGELQANVEVSVIMSMIPTGMKPQEEKMSVNRVNETPRHEPNNEELGVSICGQKHGKPGVSQRGCPESCEGGFELINGSCVDKDECAFDGNDCIHNGMLCINTPGSFECQSHDSTSGSDGNPSVIFEIVPDLTYVDESEEELEKCQDPRAIETCGCFEDEICAAEDDGGCSCVKFSCPDGQKIQDTRCVPLSTPDPCKTGRTRDDNGTCIDINECLSNPCPEGENCYNNYGSFDCVKDCEPGSRVETRWFVTKCYDIDECSEKTHNCSDTQICTNLDPGFTCDCKNGYLLNQETGLCEDVDDRISKE